MDTRRVIAIGDIHGCSKTLKALLQDFQRFSGSLFIFLGDYIDRGPDSKNVIDQLLVFSEKEECVFLRGNHEQMLLRVLDGAPKSSWAKNGGNTTMHSYMGDKKSFDLPYKHYHFFQNTNLYYETEDFVFTHAGMDPELSVKENLEDEANHEIFLWTREHLYEPNNWEKTVIFGHTPKKDIIQLPNMIGIDTGCVFKNLPGLGILSALVLPDKKVIQINCKDDPKPY